MSEASLRLLKSGMRLPRVPSLRDLEKLYQIKPLKKFSQTFLMDERITDKIVKSAGIIDPRDVVLEVGPGPGGITRSILRRQPQRLILVEKDKRFLPILDSLKDCAKLFDIQVDIHIDDILRFDIEKHIPETTQRILLIGNIPFSICTRLIINWFEDISLRRQAFRRNDSCMILTFQKEMAERICAPLGNEHRHRISVMSQIWTKPILKFIIPAKVFVPKPNINVGVVKVIPLKQPKTDLPFHLVEKVVCHIFHVRKKYCRRGYGYLFPPENREDICSELFQKAGVEDTLRPFELSVDECLRLATVYKEFVEQNPAVAVYNFRAPKSSIQEIINGE